MFKKPNIFKYSIDCKISTDYAIEDIKLFQEDKLIIIADNCLSIFDISEKRILLQKYIKDIVKERNKYLNDFLFNINQIMNNANYNINNYMDQIRIYENLIFVIKSHKIAIFEFIQENNNNYYLNNIGEILCNPIDILFHNNQIIIEEKNNLDFYTFINNKELQLRLKVKINNYKAFIPSNGKNVFIFEFQKNDVFFYKLCKNDKFGEKYHIKGFIFYNIDSDFETNNIEDLSYIEIKNKYLYMVTKNKKSKNIEDKIYIYSIGKKNVCEKIKSIDLKLINCFKFYNVTIDENGYGYGHNNKGKIYKMDFKYKKYDLIPFMGCPMQLEKIDKKIIFELGKDLKNKKIAIVEDKKLNFYSLKFNTKYIKHYCIFLFYSGISLFLHISI